jgi:hypothetical protein
MNFEDNTLTVELSHPEIRYELDYEPKGKMFILPYDSAGHGTVTLSKILPQQFNFCQILNFRKSDLYYQIYSGRVPQ